MPALLTSRSMLGWRARIAAAARSTSLRSETSHSSYSPPSSAASDSSRSCLRATSTQCQPAPASSRAVAAPMPLDAPVTTATLTRRLLADAYDALRFGLAALRVGDDRPQRVLALGRGAPPPGRAEEAPAAPPVGREQLAAVEEADRANRGRRGREHDERRGARRALVDLRRDPRDGRPVDDHDVPGGEGRVRQQLVADGVDVF